MPRVGLADEQVGASRVTGKRPGSADSDARATVDGNMQDGDVEVADISECSKRIAVHEKREGSRLTKSGDADRIRAAK